VHVVSDTVGSCGQYPWHVPIIGSVAMVTCWREEGAGSVAIARSVLDSTASPVKRFRWSLFCVFSTRGHCIFGIFSALACGKAFVLLFPCDLLVRKPRFHERPAVRSDSFMVASPTGAYVGGAEAAVDVYGKFSTGFRFL